MNVSCPDCGSVFRVDPAKVAPEGVRAKCSICGGVVAIAAREARRSVPVAAMPAIVEIPVAPTVPEAPFEIPVDATVEDVVPDIAAPVESHVATHVEALVETPEEAPVEELDDAPVERITASFADVPDIDEMIDVKRPLTPVSQTSVSQTPIEAHRPLTPVTQAPIVAPPPVARPALTPPVRSPTPRTTMPTAVPPATPIGGAAVSGFRAGPAGLAGAGPRPPAAPIASPHAPTPVSTPPTPPPVASPSVTTPLFTTPVVGADVAPRRPVNPFLANDPSAKAKRLARALVSDMIAYLPQKREEGLRDGTLKQIFREEIKKSYEEYVDQIGREIAENTTHFQEALNDLLAGGQKIF